MIKMWKFSLLGHLLAPSEPRGQPTRTGWRPKQFRTVSGWDASISCAWALQRTSTALLGPPKELGLAPKGPLGGPGSPRWAPGAPKGSVLDQNTPFGGLGGPPGNQIWSQLFGPWKALCEAPEVLRGPRGARFGPNCPRLVRLMITTHFGLVSGLFAKKYFAFWVTPCNNIQCIVLHGVLRAGELPRSASSHFQVTVHQAQTILFWKSLDDKYSNTLSIQLDASGAATLVTSYSLLDKVGILFFIFYAC